MPTIDETRLPGVGVRQDFVTADGRRVGVITHHEGHQDLLVFDDDDPDACTRSVRLGAADSRALAELLGASEVHRSLRENLDQSIEGLAIDWVKVHSDAAEAGHTIADTELRQRTGASIVALLRGDDTVPAPGPETTIQAGDIVVLVGTRDGVHQASAELSG